MMRFISYCSSKCYENTDGQPGGHRSRRGRGPRMAWPPCAPQPSEMAGDPDGRVRGRGPQAKRSGKDSPEGAYQPRPPARRRPPDVRERALPPRRPPASPRRHPAVTCGRTEKGDIVPAQGQQDMAGPAGERKGPISFVGRDGRTWRDLQENEKGRYRSAGGARGAEGCFVRRGGRSHPGGVRPRGAHPGGSEQQEL